MAMPFDFARLPARLRRRADTPVAHIDALFAQSSGLLRFVVYKQLPRRRDHSPPGEPGAGSSTQQRSDSSGRSRVSRLSGHLAVGHEIAGLEGIKDTGRSTLEVGPGSSIKWIHKGLSGARP